MDFKEQLVKRFGFSEGDWEETLRRFSPVSVPAKTFFLEKDRVAGRLGYLRKGLMRSFFYDDHANEITTHFYRERTVVISIKSFNDQVPSREYIVAMEDCELDVITYEDMKELMERVPAWQKIGKTVDESRFTSLMNRSIQLQTLSARERYELFMRKYPDLLQRVALRHIASYLGIDIATLSRIRKSI